MKSKHVNFARLCIALASLALAACGAGMVKQDDGAAVEKRATERWNFLIAHQAEKAYDYLTPGFRQTITREKYATQKNDVAMRWKTAHVSKHTCDGDTCEVTVMIDASVPMPGVGKSAPATAPAQEHWIRADGIWYYLPDARLKAPSASTDEAKPASVPEPQKPQP